MRTLTAALFVLAAALVLALPAQAAYPGKNGRIAYVDFAGFDHETGTPTGSREIWTATADNTDHRRLTTNDAIDSEPVWSPDGRRIAFTSNRTGASQVFVMREDGTGTRQITRGAAATAPTWSPDGNLIAFARGGDIWITTAAGVLAVNLTRTPAMAESQPAWSPRGFEIAYAAGVGGHAHVWTIRITGTHARDLSARTLSPDMPESDHEPNWSPDGKRIIFTTSRTPTEWVQGQGIWMMNADGSQARMLIDGDRGGGSNGPAFGPDGKTWLSTSCLSGFCGVFTHTVSPDGAVGDLVAINGALDSDSVRDADWQPIPCRPWPLRC